MNLKSFLYIVALLIIAAAMFYVVCPKYYFMERSYLMGNKITGKVVEIEDMLPKK